MSAEVEILLDALDIPDGVREKFKQLYLEEFRRGYLMGKREMRQAVENALARLFLAEEREDAA
jgi:hypothetical protein